MASDAGVPREEIEQHLTHVVYCPGCREEKGRYDDLDKATDTREIHHIETGYSPQILTGVYDAR